MQGKILISDAIATNRIVLKVKLSSAFYDVIQACTVAETLALVEEHSPDLIIAAIDLPGGGASAIVDAIGNDGHCGYVPVLALSNDTSNSTLLAALTCGIRDVVARPLDETLFLGRVRNLIRSRNNETIWGDHHSDGDLIGFSEPDTPFESRGTVCLTGTDKALLGGWSRRLSDPFPGPHITATPAELMRLVQAGQEPDAVVIALPHQQNEALEMLRLISTLRATASTQLMGIIVVQTIQDGALGASALDLGADDLMSVGFHAAELALRLKSVLRRKRMAERRRAKVRRGLRAAVFDPLTGLYNRRFAMPQLAQITAQAQETGKQFAVMIADLDHFKRINDLYGHAAGDAVLIEIARRLEAALRPGDLVARIGGEEFLMLLPDISAKDAQNIGLRICQFISATPFDIPGQGTPICVTISIGMVVGGGDAATALDQPDDILRRADEALYAAKGKGRNQLRLGRPAA